MSARRDAIFALALWRIRGLFPTQTLKTAANHADALELTNAVLRRMLSLEWVLKQCVTVKLQLIEIKKFWKLAIKKLWLNKVML